MRSEELTFVVSQAWRQWPTICALLLGGCPPHIARFIVSVVIWPSVQGMLLRRRIAHISQEILKGMSPSVTHCDSSAAPIIVLAVIGIVTTLVHVCPSTIQVCATHAVRPCRITEPRTLFALEAPTALSAAGAKIPAFDDCLGAALALAGPFHPSGWFWITAQNKQATKSASGEIDEGWHGPDYNHVTRYCQHG